jgi:hypothetical protein
MVGEGHAPVVAVLLGFAKQDRRAGSAVGGGLLLAGSLFERLAVYRAGTQSAADPKYTVVPQRERAAHMGSKRRHVLSRAEAQ